MTKKKPRPFTFAVLTYMAGDETAGACPPIQYEILMVALARTVPQNVKEVPVYRESGVRPGSGKPKAKKHRAWKEVTQLEQRQYRQQFLQSKTSEHKSWVDNDAL